MTAPVPHYHVLHGRLPKSRHRTYRHRARARLELLDRVGTAMRYGLPISGDIEAGYQVGGIGGAPSLRFSIQTCDVMDCPEAMEDDDDAYCRHGHSSGTVRPDGLDVEGDMPSAIGDGRLAVRVRVPKYVLRQERQGRHFHAYRSVLNDWQGWQDSRLTAVEAFLTVEGWIISGQEILVADVEGCCPEHGYVVKALGGTEPVYMRVLHCGGECLDATNFIWTWEYDVATRCPLASSPR